MSLSDNIETLGYTVRYGSFEQCKRVNDVIKKINLIRKLCKKHDKLVFLFLGTDVIIIKQLMNMYDECDFIISIGTTMYSGLIKNFNTPTKIRLLIKRLTDRLLYMFV